MYFSIYAYTLLSYKRLRSPSISNSLIALYLGISVILNALLLRPRLSFTDIL